ncbi:Hypothetical predicted protein, partial [Mytilus galloprovincialis]
MANDACRRMSKKYCLPYQSTTKCFTSSAVDNIDTIQQYLVERFIPCTAKIKNTFRVVKKSYKPEEKILLGTVVKVHTTGDEVDVQWDVKKENDKIRVNELRLFDNACTGN